MLVLSANGLELLWKLWDWGSSSKFSRNYPACTLAGSPPGHLCVHCLYHTKHAWAASKRPTQMYHASSLIKPFSLERSPVEESFLNPATVCTAIAACRQHAWGSVWRLGKLLWSDQGRLGLARECLQPCLGVVNADPLPHQHNVGRLCAGFPKYLLSKENGVLGSPVLLFHNLVEVLGGNPPPAAISCPEHGTSAPV